MGETNKTSNKAIVWSCVVPVAIAILGGLCVLVAAIPDFVNLFTPDPPSVVIISPTTSSQSPGGNQSQLFNTSVPTPVGNSADLTGIWDFNIIASQGMGQDGFIKDMNASADWVVRINQAQERLTGELIGATGDVPNVCSDARLSGTINGTEVNFILQYSGACCRNERMTFSGTYDPQHQTIMGKGEPINVPTMDCNLWFSDFTGAKR